MNEIEFLKELVSIPSLSGEEDEVAEYLVNRMAALGFQAHRDTVGNVVGIVGKQKAAHTIVLLGHMDTVPGLIRVREEDGKLYGRGTVDAKGPLAAFVLAAARVRAAINGVRLVVVGAVGEESTSPGAHHLAQTMAPPDGVIIGEPSGWQGITLGYKGVLRVEYRLTQPVRHRASNASLPAEKAVMFWNRLTAYVAEFNNESRSSFDQLAPSLQRIRTFGDGLNEGVEMQISMRLPPGVDLPSLQEKLRDWGASADVSFPYREVPFRVGKNIPPVRALLRAIRTEGGEPRFKLKTGTSDMNVVGPAWGCPIVAYGPGDSTLDHTPNEHIDVSEFRKGIDVLAHALTDWGDQLSTSRRA